MPTNRRRRGARSRSYDADHRCQLMLGHNCLVPVASGGWGGHGARPPYDADTLREMEACWLQVGPVLVREYQERRPGTRPWYFWARLDKDIPTDQIATLAAMGELSPGESESYFASRQSL